MIIGSSYFDFSNKILPCLFQIVGLNRLCMGTIYRWCNMQEIAEQTLELFVNDIKRHNVVV